MLRKYFTLYACRIWHEIELRKLGLAIYKNTCYVIPASTSCFFSQVSCGFSSLQSFKNKISFFRIRFSKLQLRAGLLYLILRSSAVANLYRHISKNLHLLLQNFTTYSSEFSFFFAKYPSAHQMFKLGLHLLFTHYLKTMFLSQGNLKTIFLPPSITPLKPLR